MSSKKIFITGIAGFIGFHLAKALHRVGYFVSGCDNFNSYYDQTLKRDRARILNQLGIEIHELDLNQLNQNHFIFKEIDFTHFFHLAAQAGVRYSLNDPRSYVENNIRGFLEVLELCRNFPTMKLLFASSSSIYGLNQKTPFSEDDLTDSPAKLYAATKKSNELMAFSYHHLFQIKMIGLRFFTVYGPFGRPDMAYYSFTKAIIEDKPIDVFNQGKMKRDFTYIDDIIDGCVKALDYECGFEIFNLGNNNPEQLFSLIEFLEHFLNKKAKLNLKQMQSGDVLETFADITKSKNLLDYEPKTSLKEGLEKFVKWYQEYHRVHS